MADVKTLHDAPAQGQRVEWEGKAYTTIKEGLGYILVPETETETTPKNEDKADDKKDATAATAKVNANAGPVRTVFYNPIQQFNRDLTVLAIEAYGSEVSEARRKAHEAKTKKNAAKRKRLQEKKASVGEAQVTGEHQAETPDVETTNAAQLDGENNIKRKREENIDEEEPNKVGKPNDTTSPQEATKTSTANAEKNLGEEAEGTKQNTNESLDDQIGEAKPKTYTPKFTILDALSASGLRALRYASEMPFVTKVTANDLSPAAIEAINRNVQHNKLQSKIEVTQGNAIGHMYAKIAASMALTEKEMAMGKTDKYDVVDLDPYGTAANFLDAAVQAVHDNGGLLCVTCTDAGVWASNSYPEKAFALYGGVPIKGWYSHEVGLRLILNAINTAAARYGLYMEPLLSLSIDFYARVFVKIKKSPAAVKFAAGKTMLVYNCDSGCSAWTTQLLLRNRPQANKKGQGSFYKHQFIQGPTADQHCEHCGTKTHLAGPMYAGRLHDPEFIQRILDKIPHVDKAVYGTTTRIKGMLMTALEEHLEAPPLEFESRDAKWAEIEPYPFFFTPTALSKVIHCATPGENALRGALRGLGYRVTRSHCKPGSIKTDAPWDIIWHVMREWVRQKSPIKESSVLPNTAGHKILNADTTDKKLPEVEFNERLGSEPKNIGEKLVRYQMNPRENWGPMNRAQD